MTSPRPLIAIVDDEESVRRAIKRLVVSAGLNMEVFSDGAEFLSSLSSCRPDCVILDLHMPGMSGFEIQARIKQGGYDIPVVVITGHDTPEAKSLALSGGAKAYLLKPVQGAMLLDAIMAAIGPKKE